MMDFRWVPSSKALDGILSALRTAGVRTGAILESGRSYHFYGFDLLDQGDWLQFMGKCLLIAPLTDSRYIAHRLIDGACALRITPDKNHPKVPTVAAFL